MFQAGVKGAPPSPTRYLSIKIPWEVGGCASPLWAAPEGGSILAPQNSLKVSAGLGFSTPSTPRWVPLSVLFFGCGLREGEDSVLKLVFC